MTKITAKELLEIIDTQWAGTKEIMMVGSVGKNQALQIKRILKNKLELEGYYLPNNLVTMESVLEHFKININYLKKVRNYPKEY